MTSDSRQSLLMLVPADRRREVAEILRRDPNARKVLEQCAAGVYDAWTALELLGLEPFFNGEPQVNQEMKHDRQKRFV